MTGKSKHQLPKELRQAERARAATVDGRCQYCGHLVRRGEWAYADSNGEVCHACSDRRTLAEPGMLEHMLAYHL